MTTPASRAPAQCGGDGLFDPDGVTWKVNREAALLLGGGRALLLQIAHPLVAAGVAEHSDFRKDPFGRLRRTLDAMLTISFGTRSEAARAARDVNAIHTRVRGTATEASPAFPKGTPYRALDPKLLLWVHATLVDTAMVVYERVVGTLPERDWERYYHDSRITARLFRIPEAILPRDLSQFREYMRDMLAGDEISVTETARDLAQGILEPPVAFVPSFAFAPLNLLTAGLLPSRLREAFRISWGLSRSIAFATTESLVRQLVPWLPDSVRSMPQARAAERRIGRRS